MSFTRMAVSLAVAGVVAASQAGAQQITRVSVDSAGGEADGPCIPALISSDGRYVLFVSTASALVSNDMNGVQDVFVRDRVNGTTECVSIDPFGVPGNNASGGTAFDVPAISRDGHYVAFVSDATDLISGTTTSGSQLFVRDRVSGVTELVSLSTSGSAANAACSSASLSADGHFVAFDSLASNLVSGDTNGATDVFIRDRVAGTTERISVSAAGAQSSQGGYFPFISVDGSMVGFSSGSTDLVAGDKNHVDDAFLRDRVNLTTERVSVDSNGVEANNTSYVRGLSSDGRFIMMASLASNLVSGDTNKRLDVFVRDRSSGTTERLSVDSSGGESNGNSDGLGISADGNFVAFSSDGSNLVTGDTNGVSDVFIHDRTSGLTTRVSVDASGVEANGNCYGVTITFDGKSVSFSSLATNLVAGDTNGFMDAFVHDYHVASWVNYGTGFPGTAGVPALTSSANPSIGTSISVPLENSFGSPTSGIVCVGAQRTQIHSAWGGDLLVVPLFVVPVSFSFGTNTFAWTIPNDYSLFGITLDLQALELDPGASKGVSFSPGLEFVIGI